ncbi:PilZ domain-containing protein [Abditibacterium utsteinense]|uniref:PilZ domain-containing protein n=1 Tax=Abditibacterium utsteinense TaxID=1960156 RepID=A0A2S8SWA2_9BACT|nr:glycosyl hydrolase [Abditibacterium utsteinense]PQV65076.1 PilZ domain-containing protein [Abditibacterium utsteinense]
MSASVPDPIFSQEQRRFRRLEVSLPVWLTTRDAFDDETDVWELGTTRDISLGGARVYVPSGEEAQWRGAAQNAIEFVAKVESNGKTGEAIPCFIRSAGIDQETGRFALGIQFRDDLALDARETAVKSGLSTLKARRSWQGAFAFAALAVLLAVGLAQNLRADNARKAAQISELQKRQNQAQNELKNLSRPRLASTKSQGIDSAFRREEVRATLSELAQNMARLNDPKNMQSAIAAREKGAEKLGISLKPASTQARVQLAVAFPYGYNWPLVLDDLEAVLGRKVPQVVVFRDFSQPFPDLDAREARARGKSLQITWEPWHFSNPNAVKLADVAAGKYDKYIDSFAAASRAFGGEISLRFGHEMNGNWYPWSISNTQQNPKIWMAAYRRVHDRFRAAGASNVRWVWCINAESVPDTKWNDPFKTYPGDNYVDAIGIDGYNFGDTLAHSRWQSFKEIFAPSYARATKNHPNKPIFISETGCASTGGDKTKWLREMDESLRSDFPRVESVTWFEAAKEADWRMVSSQGSADAARKIWAAPYYRRGEN